MGEWETGHIGELHQLLGKAEIRLMDLRAKPSSARTRYRERELEQTRLGIMGAIQKDDPNYHPTEIRRLIAEAKTTIEILTRAIVADGVASREQFDKDLAVRKAAEAEQYRRMYGS